MLNFKQNEDAVSPVIGVILMVAITVILAAVIAAFVFGMTDNVQGTKTVSIGSKLDNNSIVLTVNGGPDLPTLQQLTITVNGKDVDEGSYGTISLTSGVVKDKFQVGDTIKITKVVDSGTDLTGRLLVIGKWSDGSEQILIDRTY